MTSSAAVTSSGLKIRDMVASYGGLTAINDISFTVEASEFVTLLGPSGCGKSTTLRCVAGLQPIEAGEIVIGSERVAGPGLHVRPERRHVNMVFQSYAIWPHMTVRENVAYGLRV